MASTTDTIIANNDMIELFFLSEQLSNIFKLENLGIMPYTQVTPVDIKQRQKEIL